MKANIKLELKTLTPTRLLALLRVVAEGMTDNPHFPTPPVTPAELGAMADALALAITEATEGSRQSRLQRDAQVAVVKTKLRWVADYVRMAAQGNAVKLTSSGFELAKPSGPPQVMGTPMMKAARMTGRHGEVELRWSGVANRNVYQIYMSDQDPLNGGAWTLTGVTGKISHRITDLEPYKAYWFCVSAVGALGEGARSNPVLGRAA